MKLTSTPQILVLAGLAMAAGCGKAGVPGGGSPQAPSAPVSAPRAVAQVQLPEREARLCTAIVIILDTSTSMLQSVADKTGRERPKHEIARESLEAMADGTVDDHELKD